MKYIFVRDNDKFSRPYTVEDIYRFVLNARGHNPSVADESVRVPRDSIAFIKRPRLDYENRNLVARLPFTSAVHAYSWVIAYSVSHFISGFFEKRDFN